MMHQQALHNGFCIVILRNFRSAGVLRRDARGLDGRVFMERRNSVDEMRRLVAALAVTACVGGDAWTTAQTSTSIGSYQYLSAKGVELFSTSAARLGVPASPQGYNSLSEAQRVTFEAIVHALEHEGLLHIVETVTVIWGEAFQPNGLLSTQGLDQFRISVVLIPSTVEVLLQAHGYNHNRRGHVKLPDGSRRGDGTDSARQPGRVPKLQVSWIEDDPTVGEIDIDYREFGIGHMSPGNSDVRDRDGGGIPHYQLHINRYGFTEWWKGRQ